jgi:hypothetical protein
MSTFARVVAFLLGLAIAACAFLPWTPGATGIGVPLGSLITPGTSADGITWVGSIGLPIIVAGVLVALGAIGNARSLVIIGGLAAVAIPTAWILVNAISSGAAAVPVSQIRIGAYGAAIAGFMTLILAAVAVDTRVPSVR